MAKPVIKSTDDARQGSVGHNVRYILVLSVILATAALAFVWFFSIAPK